MSPRVVVTLARSRACLALLAAAACVSPGATGCASSKGAPARACTIDPPALADWRLRADGAVFHDALGRAVLLRGVDAGGRSKLAPYAPFDFAAQGYDAALAAYLDRAASWGIDVLRVPFTWAAVEPIDGHDDDAFLARYDALLDAAWARGMWTVVDFHQDAYAEPFCGDGFPVWTLPDPKPTPRTDCGPQWARAYFDDAAVRAAFDRVWAPASPVRARLLAMWDRMVARHRDRPGVIGFEPMNEPGWGTQDVAAFEAGALSSFYAEAVPRMRAAAPTSLVFVEPTGFAGFTLTTTLARPAGNGIVFAPHYYPSGSSDPDFLHDGMAKWRAVGAAWGVPVFVGEFGTKRARPGALAYIRAHFDALDDLQMSGTEWEYSVAAQDWNEEGFSLVAADGTEYEVAQAIVRPYARAVAGHDVTSAFDAAHGAFTLAYAPDARTVTEVALPARAYPSGYDVALDGACYDASRPGRLLVQPDEGATRVSLRLTKR